MTGNIDACPICGGELQATRKEYTSGVVIRLRPERTSVEIVDEGTVSMAGEVTAFYCENDHDESAIFAELTRPKYVHQHPQTNDHPVTRTRKVDSLIRVCRDCGENVVEATP